MYEALRKKKTRLAIKKLVIIRDKGEKREKEKKQGKSEKKIRKKGREREKKIFLVK